MAATAVLAAALAADAVAAKRVGLDPGFGRNGLVRKPTPGQLGSSFRVIATASTAGGELLVGVEPRGGQPMLLRYLADGRLDPGYGVGGVAPVPLERHGGRDAIVDLALDSRGRAVVLGNSPTLAVARLLPDGSVDPGFGAGGVLRPDFGFGTLPVPQGFMPGDQAPANVLASRLEIDGSGRIVLAGTVVTGYRLGKFPRIEVHEAPLVARLSEAGQLDPAFGGSGSVVIPELTDYPAPRVLDLGLAPGDRPTLAACRNLDYGDPPPGSAGVFRFNPDGSRDGTIGPNGWRGTAACPTALAIDDASRLAVLLEACDLSERCVPSLQRWKPNGSLDRRFADRGRLDPAPRRRTPIWQDVAIDEGGRILLGGIWGRLSGRAYRPAGLVLGRLTARGRPDRSLSRSGRLVVPHGGKRAIAAYARTELVLGPAGRMVLATTTGAPGRSGARGLLLAGFRGG